ncbi:hypothetical protein HY488_02165 [Candidatus Woesearchaeota archaeon]|nr:hypothetical protein [Candidatus Woesearchaeota archaeon]
MKGLDELLAWLSSPKRLAQAAGLVVGGAIFGASAPVEAARPQTLKCDTNKDNTPDTDFTHLHTGSGDTANFTIYGNKGQYCVGVFDKDAVKSQHIVEPLLRNSDKQPSGLYIVDSQPTRSPLDKRAVFEPSLLGGSRQNEALRTVLVGVLAQNYTQAPPAVPVQTSTAPATPAVAQVPTPAAPATPATPTPAAPATPAVAQAPTPAAPVPAVPTPAQQRAAAMVVGLGSNAPSTVVEHLQALYAGLPDRYQRNLGCVAFPIATTEFVVALSNGTQDRAYTFVQPSDIGSPSGRNASLDTTIAALYRCDTLFGIVGKTGAPKDAELEQWVSTVLKFEAARNMNKWYMNNEAVAQPGDFEVVYGTRGGMHVVQDIRAKDNATRDKLNQKAKEKGLKNIVGGNRHVLWLPNRSNQPTYGYDVPATFIRPDSPSVVTYERANPTALKLIEDTIGDVEAHRGNTSVTLGDTLPVVSGGAAYQFTSTQNTDTTPNNGDAVDVYAVTPAGSKAAVTRASLASLTTAMLDQFVNDGKLFRVSETLPSTASAEDGNAQATLEPGKTYVVVAKDKQPGGTSFRARAFETVLDKIPDSALGTVVAQYAGATGIMQRFELGAPKACVPSNTDAVFMPEGIDASIETRADVVGVGATIDPAQPFGTANDFNTPVRVSSQTTLIEYLRRQGSSNALNRTFEVAVCAAPIPRPAPKHVAEASADTFLGTHRMPGDTSDNAHVQLGLDYTTVSMTRPTSGSEADIDVQQFNLSGVGRLDTGARDWLATLFGIEYQRQDGSVDVNDRHVQDITDNLVGVGLGGELRVRSRNTGNAFRAYALGRGFIGNGAVDASLPDAPDGTERSLLTERDHLGLGVEGGVAARYRRAVLETAARYDGINTEEHVAFGGRSESEVTHLASRYLTLDSNLGLRFANGKYVPLVGAVWTHETQRAEVNDNQTTFDNTLLQGGLRWSPTGKLTNLLLVGYDRETGMLRLYDRLDLKHVGAYLQSNIPVDADRSNVRNPVDGTTTPYVNGGLEVRF